MKKDLLREKSFAFALRIIKLSQYLQTEHKEYILSKQIIRSGTSIGALIREAQYAQSKADFLHKLTIALKEANETEYWLLLLKESGYLNDKMLQSIQPEIDELLKLLISSTKKIKENLK
ncbi:four helix bundle protein [Sulfurovum sp. ST-21]|uniref:Four helix bundle protein n=1 Tax=Sulfurovum indicum TaxID=2779528 RepID=A0A7M1S4A1_9BACT|nr:four helix bundle protein [Sulfurovum indicum]QOR62146.1 four helix bundle protein [Sulfurovum indicum]